MAVGHNVSRTEQCTWKNFYPCRVKKVVTVILTTAKAVWIHKEKLKDSNVPILSQINDSIIVVY